MNKNEKSQKRVADRKKVERRNGDVEKLRMELGEIGGAGHFFGNDKWTDAGGARNVMGERELKNILRLLALGEQKINLKEREFRAFLSEKKRKETQKSFWLGTIGKSPRLDGRSSSSLIGKILEEMENIIISGWKKKVKTKI